MTFKAELLASIQNQQDITHCQLKVDGIPLDVLYVEGMADMELFNQFYLKKISADNYQDLAAVIPGILKPLEEYTIARFNYLLYRGHVILMFSDDIYYQLQLNNAPKRNVEASQLDPTNLLDSRDGLVENIKDNIALIRKRLKTSDLTIQNIVVGSLSQTDVAILCLKDFREKKYYHDIEEALFQYQQTSATSINDINHLFQKNSLLPLAFNSSSPETLADALVGGKVVILLDNSPIGCVLPASLTSFTAIKNEVNAPKYYTIFSRMFVFIFFFLALFMLGLFISIINFHPSSMSMLLIANIQLTERGTTFPMFIEVVVVLFLFEFYRFSTSRSPLNYVQNIVIIFGGMFIGYNAINSGVIGTLILMIASLSYISAFAITNNPQLITSISIFRLFILVTSYTLGLFGFIISGLTTLAYFYKQKSTGSFYLSPFLPTNWNRIRDFLLPKHVKGEIDK